MVQALELMRRAVTTSYGTDMGHPFHTLLATALSAQTTDKQVLKIYPAFRKRFPTPQKLAQAPLKAIEAAIQTVGLYKTKAKNIRALSRMLLAKHGGEVPRTMHALVELPGVGRKTASIVLSCCFGVPAIAVDTHVHRVANRLGWVKTKTPERTEKALLQKVPQAQWQDINLVLVPFGRAVCQARAPKCPQCPVKHLCKYPRKTVKIL